MKKWLLTIISGLLIFTSIGITNTNKLVTKMDNNSQINWPKIWKFDAVNIVSTINIRDWLYFAIDNINLSDMGINCIDKLHTYNVIEIPGLKIKCSDIIFLSSDKWNPKIRNLESENWHLNFYVQLFNDASAVKLGSAATLWYSDDGDLMMRLAYKVRIIVFDWLSYAKGKFIETFTFQTGNIIKIY